MSNKSLAARVVSRRWIFWSILAGGGAVVGARTLQPSPTYAGDALSVAEAHKLATSGQITLVDIRRPDEWRRTGLGEGAHPIDMRRDDFIQALSQVAGHDRTAPIALICAGGVRSARLSRALTEAGYTNAIDVPEGMLGSKAGPGWVRSGLPTTSYKGS